MAADRAKSRLAVLCLLLLGTSAASQSYRIASYNIALSREYPGELVQEFRDGASPQIDAIVQVISTVRPDILLLNEIDFDADFLVISALQELLAASGHAMPHAFALPPNSGTPSRADLDGDGQVRGPGDAFGFGFFPGQYGMAILSRWPINADAARDFSTLRWLDMDWAQLPVDENDERYLSDEALGVFRLSSKGHWDVPVQLPENRRLHLLTSHPTPPVFDGPEDLNGLRNAAEIEFWERYVGGTVFIDSEGRSASLRAEYFVVLGDLNADPTDGDGRRDAVQKLLAHPLLQDPMPASTGAAEASLAQAGSNRIHAGDPALDTADWDDAGPGNLRVDYVLPSATLSVLGSGVYWPGAAEAGSSQAAAASDHRLVWVDISF